MDNNKSSTGWVPEPLAEAQLKRLVVEAVAEGANAVHEVHSAETYHALHGHVDRNIQTSDVLYALRAKWKKFKVQKPFNQKHWQWKYRVVSEDADGRQLVLIIGVDTANREIQVVTRWPENDDSA